jgi:nicotinamide mononucleotide transporter PnuC
MNIIHIKNKKFRKYALWFALLFTEVILGCITQSHIFVIAVALLGVISALFSAEGWYATHFVFLIYAAGSMTVAWHHELYGEVLAMGISALGSMIAIITWRRNLQRNKVRTRSLTWKNWILVILSFIAIGVISYVYMLQTGGTLPILNALVMGLTITAEFLFMLRYCESYVLYFIDDIALILMWALTGNWILVCSCVISTLCTVYGIKNWKDLRRE